MFTQKLGTITKTLQLLLISFYCAKQLFAIIGPYGTEVEELYCENTVCPPKCAEYEGEACDCYDATMTATCQECSDGYGCTSCNYGYFQLSTSYYCANCQLTGGDSCISCKDGIGCDDCLDSTELVYDSKCGVFVCKDHCSVYAAPTPKPHCGNTPYPTPVSYPTEPTVPAPTFDPNECPRHRKPWHKLTNSERMLYINGWLYLHNNGQIPSYLNSVHSHGTNAAQAHGGSGFLPWHRYFLWELETLIRNIGPEYECFGLPYFDWGHDALNGGSSIIYSSGLSAPSPSGDGCVINNHFDSSSYTTFSGCLTRNSHTVNQLFSSGFKQSSVLLGEIVDYPNYGNYRAILESSHNSPHVRIGGHMSSTATAANDPLFYLHHCFIDFNWAVWQDCHNYDLIDKNNLDGNNAAYFGSGSVSLDSQLSFVNLYGTSWGQINNLGFNPTVRDMHDITDWNVRYDIGDFWDEAGVEDQLYCGNNMNSNWFTGDSLFNNDGTVGGNSDYSTHGYGDDSSYVATYVVPDYIEDGYSQDVSQCDAYSFNPCESAVNGKYNEYGYVNYGYCDCDTEIDYTTCESCTGYNGCDKCKAGYFKKTDGHNCVECNSIVGYGCETCSDYVGCSRCYPGYNLVYDSDCDLWKCERIQEPCPKEYLYEQREYLHTRDDLTDCEKRSYMTDVACEYSNRNLLDRGIITSKCEIPYDFEDCGDLTEEDVADQPLEYFLEKGGVRDSECLQDIRRELYDWVQMTGQLLGLCNGAYDPIC